MNKKYFAAILFVVFILVGSTISMVYRESEMAHEGSAIIDPEDPSAQPSFVEEWRKFGFYQTRIDIPNPENTKQLQINSDGVLQFPKGTVLAIAIHKYGEDITLLDENEEIAVELLRILQNINFEQETDNTDIVMGVEQDTEIYAVLLSEDGSYALLTINTYKDGSVLAIINQEKETRILLAKSESLRSYTRELCGLRQSDDRYLREAQEIKYFADEKWNSLSKADQNELYFIIKTAEIIPNYSLEKAFPVKMILMINGEIYNAKVSREGDLIILEDAVFKISNKDIEKIKHIFQIED